MSWTTATVEEVLSILKNGVNCKQNKDSVGEKITRIETISNHIINYKKTGFSQLTNDQKDKSKLETGDILFSHINSPIHVGKTAIYQGEEDLYHGINLLLMRTIKDVNPKYFNYFLKNLFSSGYWIENCKQAVNQASVNQQDIKKIPFFYPPLPVQKQIVKKLDTAFADIDKAISATQKNIENSYILYQNQVNILLNKIDRESIKLGDVAEIKYGFTSKSSMDIEGTPLLRITDIQDDNVNWSTVPKCLISDEDLEKYKLLEGDILFARTGATTGKSYLIKKAPLAVYASYLIKLSVDKNRFLPEFLYHYFKSYEYWETVKKGTSGAAQGGFNATKLGNLEVPNIPRSGQENIVNRLDTLLDLALSTKQIYKKKSMSLESLKTSILNQAFSGELTKDAA